MSRLIYFFILFTSLNLFGRDFELEKVKDLGELQAKQQLIVIFNGKNTGENSLEITKVKTSCACMSTEVKTLSVAKGKDFQIPIKFNTGKMIGVINKTVSVSIKGHRFPIMLRVKANVASSELTEKPKELIPQKTCPYKGSPIDENLYYEYQGQKIYVCCEPCLEVVEKNPKEAVSRLRDLYGESLQSIKK